MSGNLCRCGPIPTSSPRSGEAASPMKPFDYLARHQRRRRGRARRRPTRRGLPRRRHQPRRPPEARGRRTRTLLVDVSRLPLDDVDDRPTAGLRIGADVRNSDLAAASGGPRGATRCCPGRCSPARRASCATSPPPAGTCCSARAACTSRTSPRRATSASPAPAAPRIGGYVRYHAILGASEHCVAAHPSDMAVALAALDAVVVVLGPTVSGGSRSPTFTGCPATSPTGTPSSRTAN